MLVICAFEHLVFLCEKNLKKKNMHKNIQGITNLYVKASFYFVILD